MKGFILLFLFIITIIIPAQVNQHRAPFLQMPGSIDSLRKMQYPDPGEEKKIIVEFKGNPMIIEQMKSAGLRKPVPADFYLSRFSQFAEDLNSISRSVPSSLQSQLVIRNQYYKTFFGISLSLPSELLPMIQKLPYVKTIHFEHEVEAETDTGIILIGAGSVWQFFGTQGEGIRIGIIDSGIDYLHPALGGGIGPGFKVAGGYDFVNDDNDPMDDYGHGTHVAGIIAADADTVKGVAPKSTIFAYKVLNSLGLGTDSDVLEAIELTVDPDQDGDFSDKLDVVNISLGSHSGSPIDPASTAVDNATMFGVVFCIAAGNSGARTPVEGKENNYFYDGSASISSPGSAELAITVGASDFTDKHAVFSSRGPNKISFSIKPEVIAPGVNIYSTHLFSGFRILSGTSMAAAMVTGVAALIKSVHPSWTPELIKSAIVNTALDAGFSPYLQGGGRVRALDAVSAKTLVTPAAVSFGLDDPPSDTWAKAETLYIYNKHSETQLYSASINGISNGISLNVSPASFSIPPEDSLMVIAALSVSNSQVLIENENILRYTGNISFNGSIDSARVPWAFVRTNILVITASEPNAFFLGYSNASAIISTDINTVSWVSPSRAEVYAPLKGTYEFFTLFRNPVGSSKIVINEGVSINNNAVNLFLDGTLAVNPLVYKGVDHRGNPLNLYPAPQRSLLTSLPNFGDWITTFRGGSDTLLLSQVGINHSFKPFEFQVDLPETKTFHIAQFERFTGMNGPKILTNAPEDFIEQHFRMKVPPGTSSAANVIQVWYYTDAGGSNALAGIGFDIDTITIDYDEYRFTGYFGKSFIPSEDAAVKFYTSYSNISNLSIDYDSPYIMSYKDSIIASLREFVSPAVPRFESGATMTMGGAPVFLLMLWYNNIFGPNTLHFRTIFRGMLSENRNNDELNGTYSLYDKNGVKLFTKSLTDPREPLELTADTYKVSVTSSNYWLRNARGTVNFTSEFNFGSESVVPPSITSFMILDRDGHPGSFFEMGEQAVLQFSVNNIFFSDNVPPPFDSVKAWYRKFGSAAWIPLPLIKIAESVDNEGLILRADLSNATAEDSVAVDLRVQSKDLNGFSVEEVISPAFAVGNWDAPATDVEIPPDHELPSTFALHQNFPNPFNPATAINYQVAKISIVKLKVYDLLGQEIAVLVNEKKMPGKYSVIWDASEFSSGVYFYRLEAGTFTETKKMLLLK